MAGPEAATTATSDAKAAARPTPDPWYIEHPVAAIAVCFAACIFVAVVWAGVVYQHGAGVVDGVPEAYGLGTFGDAFGPVAALFNAAALAAALVAVVLQRRELAMQREEMALAREEMAAQREEMHGQREAAERHAAAIERANDLAAEANVIARASPLLPWSATPRSVAASSCSASTEATLGRSGSRAFARSPPRIAVDVHSARGLSRARTS